MNGLFGNYPILANASLRRLTWRVNDGQSVLMTSFLTCYAIMRVDVGGQPTSGLAALGKPRHTFVYSSREFSRPDRIDVTAQMETFPFDALRAGISRQLAHGVRWSPKTRSLLWRSRFVS
jgi:hypothetical protein